MKTYAYGTKAKAISCHVFIEDKAVSMSAFQLKIMEAFLVLREIKYSILFRYVLLKNNQRARTLGNAFKISRMHKLKIAKLVEFIISDAC